MAKTINAMTIQGGAPELQEKTATENGTVTPDERYDGLSRVLVNVQPSLQSKSTTENGTVTPDAGYDGLSSVSVNVQPELQTKSATPTESAQTVTPDEGYDGLSSVSVGAIDSGYVGSDITRRSSSDLTASGAAVSVPAGYYETGASKSVQTAELGTPRAHKVISGSSSATSSIATITPEITQEAGYVVAEEKSGTAVTVRAAELVYRSKTIRRNGQTDVTEYKTAEVNVQPSLQEKTVAPTESTQTVTTDTGYDGLSSVSVGAIPSSYVGSGITRRASSDLTASGATVTAPAGYYASSATKSIASGTQGTPTATKGTVTNHAVSVTPSCTDTTGYITGVTKTGTPVTVTASELVSGTKSITTNGTVDVSDYASVNVNVSGEAPVLQTKSVTPTESEQSVEPDAGYDGLSNVTVGAIDSEYVGSAITRRTSSNLTASGATVTAPAGYYASSATKSVASGTQGTPTATKGTVTNHSVNVTPSCTDTTGYITGTTKTGTAVTVTASELVSGTKSITENGTEDVTSFASVSVNVQPDLQSKSATPTESTQTVSPDAGYDGLSSVSVGAIPSSYVGSGIPRRSSTDLTASGASVSVPAGYYETGTSKSVQSGTQGTPTATKGTVTNHSVNVTPSCTDTTGYITGTTKTGTAVTVTASELVSGTKSITQNGTSDVTDYASVSVNVPGASLQTKTVAPTESTQTVTPDSGYDGLSSVSVGAIPSSYVGSGITRRTSSDLTVSGAQITATAGYYASSATKSVASGTQGTPTATKGTVTNHSVSVTPSCTDTTGYITGTTKTGTAVTVTASELVSGSETKTENGTYDVTNLAQVVVNVQGSGGEEHDMYAGKTEPSVAAIGDLWVDISDESGGGLPDVIRAGNTPVLLSSALADTVNTTSIGATDVSITVPKAGTYRFKCSGARTSTSGIFTTQLYKGNSAVSGATMTWSSRQGMLTADVPCSAGDTITVRARSGSSSSYTIVGQLVACIDWDIWG